jgi:photosystem II stability/assembly factor-like uncharacterized protein
MRKAVVIALALGTAAVAAGTALYLKYRPASPAAQAIAADAAPAPRDAAPAVTDAAPPTTAVDLLPQGLDGFADLPSNYITALARHDAALYVGTDAGLAVTRDAGATFTVRTRQHGLPSNQVLSLHAGANALYVGTDQGLAISRDHGESFSIAAFGDDLATGPVTLLAGTGSRLYAVAGKALVRTDDGGASFSISKLPSVREDAPIEALLVRDDLVFMATNNQVLYSRDRGASFERATGTVYVEDRSRGEMCGDESCIMPYPVLGNATEVEIESMFEADEPVYEEKDDLGISSLALVGDVLHVGTQYGLMTSETPSVEEKNPRVAFLYRYMRFRHERLEDPSRPWGMAIDALLTDGADVLLVSDRVYAGSEPLSEAEYELPSPTAALMSGNSIIIGTTDGLWRSDDRGQSFTQRTTRRGLPSTDVARVAARGDTILALSGRDAHAVLSVSHDGGASFVPLDEKSLGGSPRDVTMDETRVIVATTDGLATSTDRGKTFTHQGRGALAHHFVEAVAVRDGTIHAATRGGMSSSRDGVTFESYLPCPAGAPSCTRGKHLGDFYSLDAAGERLYARVSWDQLHVSQDGGKTFTRLAGIDQHGRPHAAATHGDRLLVATDKGVLVSADHGQSFQPLAQIDALIGEQIHDLAVDGITLYLATRHGLYRITHAPLTP